MVSGNENQTKRHQPTDDDDNFIPNTEKHIFIDRALKLALEEKVLTLHDVHNEMNNTLVAVRLSLVFCSSISIQHLSPINRVTKRRPLRQHMFSCCWPCIRIISNRSMRKSRVSSITMQISPAKMLPLWRLWTVSSRKRYACFRLFRIYRVRVAPKCRLVVLRFRPAWSLRYPFRTYTDPAVTIRTRIPSIPIIFCPRTRLADIRTVFCRSAEALERALAANTYRPFWKLWLST